ncbi:hypothetical protein [Empedobacter brevis]|uniref:Uncharacterized protein n=1 Tax=Empedobacter brevis NBRC 14943 = ATCC 43319 TaxID=1218108 RepID=A0A511NKT9_9FLAO|nr:hypothetical protein [Empedobacter brevis]GEM53432.1 hypothetical protein EB1_32220 [Empedobacter brevis NBRC 14943 = ATCC 43319]
MDKEKTNQEIDLYVLWQYFLSVVNNLFSLFFRVIKFFIKHIYIVTTLIVLGFVVGYFLDLNKSKKFEHQIILIPNFESSTYLYEYISNYKLSKDSPIVKVDIEPIIDVYQFVSTDGNLKIAEYLSENNVNIINHNKGGQSEKIYKYHLLTITTIGKDKGERIIKSFLSKLNSQPHFLKAQQISKRNTELKIVETLASIKNTNGVFEKLSGLQLAQGKSDLNIEMYPDINGLLLSKQGLVDQIGRLKLNQIEQTKTFYDISILSDIEVKSIPYKIIFPLLFLFFFTIIVIYSNKKKIFLQN